MSYGSLRASDADRAQVGEVLHTAYAEGRLTLDEHAERIEAMLNAKTFDDLTSITADLVPPAPEGANPDTTKPDTTEPDTMSALLSEVKRVGPWHVRRHNITKNLLGSIYLDLTTAVFDARVVEINTTSVLGSLKVRVPLGTTVRDETAKVLGSTTFKNIGRPDPERPTVVLTGTCVLGSITVCGPRKSLFSPKHA
jgi:hypothetical protein